MILGGGVKGGDLYGSSRPSHSRVQTTRTTAGVWVPSTSLEHYGASLATWFGVTQDQLTQVFPNLPNFKTPPSFRLRAPWLVLLLYSVSVAIAGLALKGADLLKQMNHLCRSLI